MTDPRPETEELVRLVAADGERAVDALFERHTARLSRMIQARLDRRLRGRVDVEDVVQEVHLQASRRLQDYLADPKLPFFVWLRFLARQTLVDLQRRHLGAQARDVRREGGVPKGAPGAESEWLAGRLAASVSTPSQHLARAEIEKGIEVALERLSEVDREVLLLKHYEELSNVEIAHELDIEESAASKRYVRALTRAREALKAVLGEVSWPKNP